MKKNKVTNLILASAICITVGLNFNTAVAVNNYWSAQPISDFLSNKIEAPDVLKNEKYTTYITREEFAQLMVGVYAKSEGIDKASIQIKNNPFRDTANLDVQRAYSLGIIQGIDKSNFKPKDNVTTEQMAVIITRFLNIKKINTSSINSLNSFTDKNDISNWAVKSLAYCVDKQIINGYQSKLQPQMPTTVEEAITMLDRIAIKNNWIVKSKDIYACGFLIPSDAKLYYEICGNNQVTITILWSNINNIEKLKNDLNYILGSNLKDDQIKDVINSMVKSKQQQGEFRKKYNLNKYQIQIAGNQTVTYIRLIPKK